MAGEAPVKIERTQRRRISDIEILNKGFTRKLLSGTP